MELYMESEDISESEFEELSQSQPQASSGSDYIPKQESDQGSEIESLDSQVQNRITVVNLKHSWIILREVLKT